MEEIIHPNKQIWRLILSKLEFEELFKIASVCKAFFFILKEDEIFWSLFMERKLNIDQLPKEYSHWKQMIGLMATGWDKSIFVDNFIEEKGKILVDVCKHKDWRSAKTRNYLIEGVLYPFKLINLPPHHLTIGVILEKSGIFSGEKSNFGVDKYGFGFYFHTNGGGPYSCTNGSGSQTISKKNFEQNGTIYLLVHKGSYNKKEKSKATVSFFNKHEFEEKPEYIFSFNEIQLDPGEFFFGFISCANLGVRVGLEKPIFFFDPSLVPSHLVLG
eukprot:TRINITY_DN6237_c0_g1_i1.p1 TRINITY_DN6237_c0_g1~~TRINITY_DN6237_c0_g1_i1.p1  ORF type:complete len:290 (+),score=65.02 TRINITY_DN6237_c0_g1_i1:56-871(+)